jgi:hypothetical protein
MKHAAIPKADQVRQGRRLPAAKHYQAAKQIVCELDCQRAVERIAELAGCIEGSDEEIELALLVEKVELWDAKRWLQ